MRNVLFLIAFVAFGCFGAVKTDTIKAIGNTIVVKDTTKFLKKVTAPVIDADSLADDVKVGGNIGLNVASLQSWSTNYNGIDLRGYGYLFGSSNSLGYTGGYGQAGITNNMRFNGGVHYAIGNGKASYMATGSGVTLFASADSVGAGQALTFTIGTVISKGGFKTEACTTTALRTGGITLSGSTNTGSFACTTKTDDFTVQAIGTAYWQKIGSVFTCSFPVMSGTSNSTTFKIYCSIPYYPMQETIDKADKTLVQIYDNGVMTTGVIVIDKGLPNYVTIYKVPGTFTASGTKEFGPSTVDYFTEN